MGRSRTAFAARNSDPGAAGNSATEAPAAEASASTGAARPAIRWPVLSVAVNVVRNPIVGGDVIHLSVRELDPLPGATVGHGKTDAGVVSDGHSVRIGGIDPNVMIVASGTIGKTAAGPRSFAAIKRRRECRGKEIGPVLIIRRDGHSKVVMGSSAETSIITNQSPVLAAIV